MTDGPSPTSHPRPLAVVVLAAGLGTRMKSDVPKVLHEVCGRPMLAYVLDAARSLGPERLVVVTGAEGAVGRGVVALALDEPGVEKVVAVGAAPGDHPAGRRRGGESVELVAAPFALDDPRLTPFLRGATRLVHLGARRGLDLDGTGGAGVDLLGTRALLSALAGVATVGTVVVLSSALVYGARRTNPVPP